MGIYISESKNLMEELLDELSRNRDIVKIYNQIGSVGVFASIMINRNIEEGEEAIKNNDVVAMARAVEDLQANKL